jgi:hypothetical protein
MPMMRSRGNFGELEERLRHRIERVGHWHDNRVRRVLHQVGRDALHDLEVVAHEIVAAHARLARLARRDHDDVGPGRRVPVGAADQPRVAADDRTGLVDVERDARRLGLGDVDDDDVGEFLLRNGPGNRHTDVAGATNHGDFTIHAMPRAPLRIRNGIPPRIVRSLSLGEVPQYPQLLLKTLCKTPRHDPGSAHDPERFSKLHHRSAPVTS